MVAEKILLLLISCFLFHHGPVRVTVYHMRGVTASGIHTDSITEPFASISRDLLAVYPMNSKVKVENCPFAGVYVIKDKMNKRIKNGLDVFLTDDSRRYTPCMCDMSVYIEEKTEEPNIDSSSTEYHIDN